MEPDSFVNTILTRDSVINPCLCTITQWDSLWKHPPGLTGFRSPQPVCIKKKVGLLEVHVAVSTLINWGSHAKLELDFRREVGSHASSLTLHQLWFFIKISTQSENNATISLEKRYLQSPYFTSSQILQFSFDSLGQKVWQKPGNILLR